MTLERLKEIHLVAKTYATDNSEIPQHQGFAERWEDPAVSTGTLREEPLVPGGYYSYLYGLVKILSPKISVELGRFHGVSALSMFLALSEDARLYSFELYKETMRRDCLKDIDDPRLFKLWASSTDRELIRQLLPDGGVDVLFIDTHHTYAQVTEEWSIWRPMMNPGGVIGLHDTHLNEEMLRFWDEIQETKIDDYDFFSGSGFGLVGV